MVRIIAEDRNLQIVFARLSGRKYGHDVRTTLSYHIANDGITGAIELFSDTCANPRWEKVILLADEEGLEKDKLTEAFKQEEVKNKGCVVVVPKSIEDWFAEANNIPKPRKRELPSLAARAEFIAPLESEDCALLFFKTVECEECPQA